MELVVSAVAGDLVNRFMSFLISKYKTVEQIEKKMKRLQDLLIRAHMIVEESEVRYITNSKMLLQLQKLVEVMYLLSAKIGNTGRADRSDRSRPVIRVWLEF